MRIRAVLATAPLLCLLASACAHSGGGAREAAPAATQAQATRSETGSRAARPGDAIKSTYGWGILERRCQGCHSLPDPRKRTRARWERGIGLMMKRLQLPPADWDSLLALVPADSSVESTRAPSDSGR